jgi:hypothetical protein
VVLAQTSTATGKVETLKQRVRVLKTCEAKCTKIFDDFQKMNEHGKIRDWVSEYQPENVYMEISERIQLDKYPGCGQWLVEGNSLRQRLGLPRSRPNSTWPYYALDHFMAHCTAAAEELRRSLGIDSLLIKWIVDPESPATLPQWLSFQVHYGFFAG